MRTFFSTLLLLAALAPAARAHESPVDHVDRQYRLSVKDGLFQVSYRVGLSRRAALLQMRALDTNADGHVTDAEAAAFFTAQAVFFAGLMELQIDGHALALKPAGPVKLDPLLGQTYLFSAPLGTLAAGEHSGRLIDGHSRLYPGSYRWIKPGEGRPTDIRVEPVAKPAASPEDPNEHPPWVGLTFKIVVPR